jgi:hypothetical protein
MRYLLLHCMWMGDGGDGGDGDDVDACFVWKNRM